jgi:hypothetical protein
MIMVVWKVEAYLDKQFLQLVLIIRHFGALLSSESNLHIHRSQVRLATLAEHIEETDSDHIRKRYSGPCPLGIIHANLSGRETL